MQRQRQRADELAAADTFANYRVLISYYRA